jgi:hypothetical protein
MAYVQAHRTASLTYCPSHFVVPHPLLAVTPPLTPVSDAAGSPPPASARAPPHPTTVWSPPPPSAAGGRPETSQGLSVPGTGMPAVGFLPPLHGAAHLLTPGHAQALAGRRSLLLSCLSSFAVAGLGTCTVKSSSVCIMWSGGWWMMKQHWSVLSWQSALCSGSAQSLLHAARRSKLL